MIPKKALAIVLAILCFAGGAGAADYQVLHKFKGPYHDGEGPAGVLVFDASGNLFGTTGFGGKQNRGTVFKLVPQPDGNWTETIVYNFYNKRGSRPAAGLVLDGAGDLYGTTFQGGAKTLGSVFELIRSPDGSWSEKVIHSFNRHDGKYPTSSLVFDTAGNLYGVTESGGSHGRGTAFKLAPNPDGSWNANVIYNFGSSDKDGTHPYAALVFDAEGNLYGTTSGGGSKQNGGTVFRLSPNPDGTWVESILHAFKGGSDSCTPLGPLTFSASGKIYGTTVGVYCTGSGKYGGIFEMTQMPDGSWSEQVIYHVKGPPGPVGPRGGLTFDASGKLYGTSESGGNSKLCQYGCGSVFELTPNPEGEWTLRTVHSFHLKDGQIPYAGVIIDSAGTLYGSTASGGKTGADGNAAGVVFKIIL